MPAHRTQEQRRAETRSKLLDATIKSLVENGYAGTTTRSVAALAGVSPGAIGHYFPRRVDLIAGAMERLIDEGVAAWRDAADELRDDPERIPALLDRSWAEFSGPSFGVFVKVWTAAAGDPELYERLAQNEEQISHSIAELAEALQDEPGVDGWEGRLLVTLAAIRGLALTEYFEPRKRAHPDPWPLVRATLLADLRQDVPAH